MGISTNDGIAEHAIIAKTVVNSAIGIQAQYSGSIEIHGMFSGTENLPIRLKSNAPDFVVASVGVKGE